LHAGGVMLFMSLESLMVVPAVARGTPNASRTMLARIALAAVAGLQPIFIFLIKAEIKELADFGNQFS
jgi:hypothetical protein